MLRSLVFTCLLDWEEFGSLPIELGTLVVTDLTEKITRAQRAGDTRSVWDLYREYRRDITVGTTEPGVLARYALALRAGQR